jgi:hypothetical protein
MSCCIFNFLAHYNSISVVMVSVLASRVVDRGIVTIILIFAASPLSTQH